MYVEARTVLRAVVTDFFLTVGVWRSLRINVFGTYQGASTIVRITLDWKHSRICVFVFIVRSYSRSINPFIHSKPHPPCLVTILTRNNKLYSSHWESEICDIPMTL
jgi:hypothetical protein